MILFLCLAVSPFAGAVLKQIHQAGLDLQVGSYGAASRRLAKAAGWIPWRAGLWEQAGRSALLAEDSEFAARCLETALAAGDLSAAGLADLGDAYRQNGDLPAAVRSWQAAEAEGGPSVALTTRLLEVHKQSDDPGAVLADLTRLAALQPAEARWPYEMGLRLAAVEPGTALAYLAQAADLDPGRRKAAEALIAGIRTAQLSGDPAYTLVGAGRSLASLSEWALAAGAFEQAALLRPDYAEAWAYLGEARQHLDRVPASGTTEVITTGDRAVLTASAVPGAAQDPALEALQRAVALDPRSLSARLFLALYWQRQGLPGQALESLQEAARQLPGSPEVQIELGNTQAILGDLKAAHRAYQRALDLAPNDPASWRAMAGFALKYEYELRTLGLPAARRAVLLAPQDPASLDLMAVVLLRLNDQANAERFLQRALQIRADFTPAHLHLGWLYLLQKQTRRAYLAFERAVSIDPASHAGEQARQALETYFP